MSSDSLCTCGAAISLGSPSLRLTPGESFRMQLWPDPGLTGWIAELKSAHRVRNRWGLIQGFEIGQLVKFHPNANHHDEDGNYPWGIDHVIARVVRRNPNTVSVLEVSRRRYNSDVEQTNFAGRRWRMHPSADDILDE